MESRRTSSRILSDFRKSSERMSELDKRPACLVHLQFISVHLHPRHGGVVHIVVVMGHVRGPDFLRIGFIGIHVHHPSQHMRQKHPALGLTLFLGSDRTQQAELGMRPKILGPLSGWRFAEIDVLVLARDAQRDSLVQLLVAGVDPICVHHAYQRVSTVRSFVVEQRGRLQRIEMPPSSRPYSCLVK